MHIILIIYLVFFTVSFGWKTTLSMLNYGYVRQRRSAAPVFAQPFLDPVTYTKSVDYTLTRLRFGLITSVFSSAFLLVMVLTGALGGVERLTSGLGLHVYTGGVLYVFLISLIFSVFAIPFSLYSQFVIEEKYGFNRMTLGLFLLDTLKSTLLSLLLGVPLLYALFWFMDRTGRFWWIYAFLGFTVFQLFISIIYPLVIAPLFNKFTPLEDGSLKDRIQSLAEKLGFRAKGIFVMDGSRRSRHSNAYFTGLGRAKRIVLFDTLFKSMEDEEVAAVLAHEIGHEKKNHIKKSLILSLAFSLIGFWLLSLLLHFDPFFHAFGFTGGSYHAAVAMIGFCTGPISFFLKPLLAYWSRKREYQADRFSAEALENPEPLKNALISLGKDNLTNLTPHPWYSFYHYSHPTLSERMAALDRISAAEGHTPL